MGCDNNTTAPTVPQVIHGCLDSQACNYDATATIENNNCIYVSDCAGLCGGDKVIDECGICGGNSPGTCTPETKALLTTKERCEFENGQWIPNCN